MARWPEFKLQFEPSQIPLLAQRYLNTDSQGKYTDAMALAAGARIRDGELSVENFLAIYRWKMQSFEYLGTERRFLANDPEEITHACQLARSATTENEGIAAIAFLDTLDGIGIPVASAVLTVIHPHAFTVIDRQAFKALGASWKEPLPMA